MPWPHLPGRRVGIALGLAYAAILVVAVTSASPDGSGGGRASLGRVYAPTSPLNQPIPANPAIDPNSPQQIRDFAQVGEKGGFVIAVDRYTVPVYVATATTRRYRVFLRASWAPKRSLDGVPIPGDAAPDPAQDGHLAIVDQRNRCEYDFWKMRRDGQTWSAAWGNSLRTDGSGIYRHGLSARASGFGLLAGLIFPGELARRSIHHALLFSYPYTSASGSVWPATESDGRTTGSTAIPEGARLQLDPGFDVSSLPPYERTVARALQRYGMYLGDTGAANVSLYAVNPQSYANNPFVGVLPDSDYVPLDGIPLNRFRVLAHRPAVRRNVRLVRSGCGTFR
jgi:hypothetical protein